MFRFPYRGLSKPLSTSAATFSRSDWHNPTVLASLDDAGTQNIYICLRYRSSTEYLMLSHLLITPTQFALDQFRTSRLFPLKHPAIDFGTPVNRIVRERWETVGVYRKDWRLWTLEVAHLKCFWRSCGLPLQSNRGNK